MMNRSRNNPLRKARLLVKTIKLLKSDLKNYFKFNYRAALWRSTNRHNYTTIGELTREIEKISVGNCTYGKINVLSFFNEKESIVIGNYVSIADNVFFVLGGIHQVDTFTSFPIQSILIKSSPNIDARTKGPIIIEDEVWIGTNVTILSGVKIGKGAIVAAGSVVVSDVLPFSIVGGNPAKFIKWKIPEELIQERSKINLIEFDRKVLVDNYELFYAKLDQTNLNKIKKLT